MEGGHSHLRRRRVPPRPRRLAPMFPRLTEVFRYQTHQYPHSHKITSVGRPIGRREKQYHNDTQTPVPTDSRHATPKQAPPSGRRGVKQVFVGMKHSRLKSANAPSLWGDFQEPLSQKGFLKLLSFPGFLCRSKESLKEQSTS